MNLKNDGGRTALHYAASKGRLKIAEILMSHGAKINAKDKVCNFKKNQSFSLRKPQSFFPFSTFQFPFCTHFL